LLQLSLQRRERCQSGRCRFRCKIWTANTLHSSQVFAWHRQQVATGRCRLGLFLHVQAQRHKFGGSGQQFPHC
jgi:hypothetical protein